MRITLFSMLVLGALVTAAAAKDINGTPGDDTLIGTPEADRIVALGGNDELFGRGGDDILDGGDGLDELFGGDGNDTQAGGPGDDLLDGRTGDDTLTGGPGRDLFVYYASLDNGADTITDFNSAEDALRLHGFTAAELAARTEGADTVIDLPGGAGTIVLRGVAGLDGDDIIYRQ